VRRTWIAALLTVVLVALGDPSATAAPGSPDATAVATATAGTIATGPVGAGPIRAGAAPTAGASEGRSADVTAALDKAGEAVEVKVTALVAIPASEIEVVVSVTGRSIDTRSRPVRPIPAGGTSTIEVPLPALPDADTGVSVSLLADGATAGGAFVAARRGPAGVVTAPTLGQLPEARLDADLAAGRITAAAHRSAVTALHAVPGSAGRTMQTGAATAATVSGRATYTYRYGVAYPVREGQSRWCRAPAPRTRPLAPTPAAASPSPPQD
jgi:hypothetical protein